MDNQAVSHPHMRGLFFKATHDDVERRIAERTAALQAANARLHREIVERRQAEAEREQLIKELEAKNEELGRFTYTVSHDLKSPLVTIKGFLGLLEHDAAQGDEVRVKQDIAQIRNAADTMQRLLKELLQLSRSGSVVNLSGEIAMTEVAREAVALLASPIAARSVDVDVDPAMPVVIGDRTRLLQVFQNLLGNAIKFMGSQPHPRISVGVRQEEDKTVFFVKDNGQGIALPDQQKVFQLFERLDPEVEGTGLGLPMVKYIVEGHGGRIWVESEGHGQGSIFCFTLRGSEDEGLA